jgi:pantetheine-phosphate adenylyltransferase
MDAVMARIAVYPGTFDPVTLGHVDIIVRGGVLFDQLIVAVADNTDKQPLFSIQERVAFIQEGLAGLSHVTARPMSGLLMDYVSDVGAVAVLRGLRAVSDFEYEFQMAAMNRKLNPEVETVFLMSSESTTFLSSRLIKEIAGMGGNIDPFVPSSVAKALRRVLGHPASGGTGRHDNS